MIRVECAQRTPEWHAARLGLPTASGFDKIVTPKTGKASASGTKYRARLLAEWALGCSFDEEVSAYMERGTELEADAVAFYECVRGVPTEAVGFCLRDDRLVGCSPDRLVGEDGILEIKCPAPATHVAYLLGGDSLAEEYRCQIQGMLHVTGRAWVDILSFHPELPPVILRVARDETFLALVEPVIDAFAASVVEGKAVLRAKGVEPVDPLAAAPKEEPEPEPIPERPFVPPEVLTWSCTTHADQSCPVTCVGREPF